MNLGGHSLMVPSGARLQRHLCAPAWTDRNSSIKMTDSSVRSLSVRGRHGLGFDLSTARSASEGAASGIHFVPQGAASSDAAPPSQSLTGGGRASVSFWTLRATARIT